VQQNAFNGQAPATAADTDTFMVTHLLPIDWKGLVAATCCGGAMQTCSAALKLTATLVAYDLFKRHNPANHRPQAVTIGKVTTVVGTIIAIVSSPLFGHYTTIFEVQQLICYIARRSPPLFLVGCSGRRLPGGPAFLTLVAGRPWARWFS